MGNNRKIRNGKIFLYNKTVCRINIGCGNRKSFAEKLIPKSLAAKDEYLATVLILLLR